MNRKIVYLLILSFFLSGCVPCIFVLNTNPEKTNKPYIEIDGDYYAIGEEYNLAEFAERIADSSIAYYRIEFENGNILTYDSMKISGENMLAFNPKDSIRCSFKEVEYIDLFRDATIKDRMVGLKQLVGWVLYGFLMDDGSEKKESIAAATTIGLIVGSWFFFDDYKCEEHLYVLK